MIIELEKHYCDDCCCESYEWFDKKTGSKVCTDCLIDNFYYRENCTVKRNKDYTTSYLVGKKRIGGNRSDEDFKKLVKTIVEHFKIEKIEFR